MLFRSIVVIAEELDDLLNIGNLARNFNRNYYDLQMRDPVLRDAGQGQKNDAPAADVPAAMPESTENAGELPAVEPVDK